jgi:hypothetical protein
VRGHFLRGLKPRSDPRQAGLGEALVAEAQVSGPETPGRRDLAGQNTASERPAGDEPDRELARGGKDVLLGPPVP